MSSSTTDVSNALLQSHLSDNVRISEDDTSERADQDGTLPAVLDRCILNDNNDPMPTTTSVSTNLTSGLTSPPADTTTPGTGQNEETRNATTTDAQSASGEHPSELSVQRVPPSSHLHQRDRLYDSLFTSRDRHIPIFDIAFSFPGERRDRVSKIAELLCAMTDQKDGRQRIFYDNYFRAKLARPDLDLYLQRIYRDQTRLIVVFMCRDYSKKEWCGLEARAIRDLLKTGQSKRIMLLTFDGTFIDGIFSIDGHMNISNDTDDVVAHAIYDRLKELDDPLWQFESDLHQATSTDTMSNLVLPFKNAVQSIPPWCLVVALSAYILGAKFGR